MVNRSWPGFPCKRWYINVETFNLSPDCSQISACSHFHLLGEGICYKKAVLSQRWPPNVPYIWVPWNVKSRAQLTTRLSHSQLPEMPARKYRRLCWAARRILHAEQLSTQLLPIAIAVTLDYEELIVRAITFQDFQHMWSQSTNVSDRRTRHATL